MKSLSLFIFLCLVSTIGWAQSTAQINGTVSDQSGAVLPGVEVTATQTGTGLTRTVGWRPETISAAASFTS